VVRRYQRGRSGPFRSESSQDSCTSLLTRLPDQHGHRALSASVLAGLWHEHELSHGCGLLQQLMRAARLAERQPFGDDRVDLRPGLAAAPADSCLAACFSLGSALKEGLSRSLEFSCSPVLRSGPLPA
jgi:hypothetical protein